MKAGKCPHVDSSVRPMCGFSSEQNILPSRGQGFCKHRPSGHANFGVPQESIQPGDAKPPMRSLFEIEIAGKKRALEYGCDSDINDTEQAPLSEATNEHAGGLEAFIALEVHLSAAGALNNASNTGIGYESNYTRYSYQSTGDAHSRLNPH